MDGQRWSQNHSNIRLPTGTASLITLRKGKTPHPFLQVLLSLLLRRTSPLMSRNPSSVPLLGEPVTPIETAPFYCLHRVQRIKRLSKSRECTPSPLLVWHRACHTSYTYIEY